MRTKQVIAHDLLPPNPRIVDTQRPWRTPLLVEACLQRAMGGNVLHTFREHLRLWGCHQDDKLCANKGREPCELSGNADNDLGEWDWAEVVPGALKLPEVSAGKRRARLLENRRCRLQTMHLSARRPRLALAARIEGTTSVVTRVEPSSDCFCLGKSPSTETGVWSLEARELFFVVVRFAANLRTTHPVFASTRPSDFRG